MKVELDFDEALYIYNLLRQCDGAYMPDFIDLSARLERASPIDERLLAHKNMSAEEYLTDSHVSGENADHLWEDCAFYARIVPKLLKAYPEIYRMRSQ